MLSFNTHILLCTLALAASLCSCTKDLGTDTKDSEEISFNVAGSESQVSTKADDDPLADLKRDGFGTYAYFSAGRTAPSSSDTEYMSNVLIKGTESADNKWTWKADGQSYSWPKAGYLDFVSYYPYNSSPWITYNPTNGSLSSGTITLSGAEDYMFSDMAADYGSDDASKSDYSGVPIKFHHALSQVSFVINNNTSNDIAVKEISLSNIAISGNINFPLSYSPGNTGSIAEWNTTSSWSTGENTGKNLYENTTIAKDGGSFTIDYVSVIPQNLLKNEKPDTTSLNITYTDGTLKKVSLYDAGNPAWVMGSRYSYTINISQKEVHKVIEPLSYNNIKDLSSKVDVILVNPTSNKGYIIGYKNGSAINSGLGQLQTNTLLKYVTDVANGADANYYIACLEKKSSGYYITYNNGSASPELDNIIFSHGEVKWDKETKGAFSIDLAKTSINHVLYNYIDNTTTPSTNVTINPVKISQKSSNTPYYLNAGGSSSSIEYWVYFLTGSFKQNDWSVWCFFKVYDSTTKSSSSVTGSTNSAPQPEDSMTVTVSEW